MPDQTPTHLKLDPYVAQQVDGPHHSWHGPLVAHAVHFELDPCSPVTFVVAAVVRPKYAVVLVVD